jgi:hypothetical protein
MGPRAEHRAAGREALGKRAARGGSHGGAVPLEEHLAEGVVGEVGSGGSSAEPWRHVVGEPAARLSLGGEA